MNTDTVAGRLREAMRALTINEHELAQRLDHPLITINGWLDGEYIIHDDRISICQMLNLNIDWFDTGKGEMFVTRMESSDLAPNNKRDEYSKEKLFNFLRSQNDQYLKNLYFKLASEANVGDDHEK